MVAPFPRQRRVGQGAMGENEMDEREGCVLHINYIRTGTVEKVMMIF